MSEERMKCLEDKVGDLEAKIDQIMEMVYLGKHLMMFAKVLAWIGGAYITLETYIKTVVHK